MEYVSRIIDREIGDLLEAVGAILIKGPKGCGKTETARHFSASEVQIDDSLAVTTAMEADPAFLLQGDTPRLIDEWQEQPRLWNTVRHEVDRRRKKGQFLLTGSSTPRDEQLQGLHSGVGRFGVINMGTMTWFERGWSTGQVSLSGVLDGEIPPSASNDKRLTDIAGHMVTGGWPGNLDLNERQFSLANSSYFQLLTASDMSRVMGGMPDTVKVRRVMASLARNIATECAATTIAKDVGGVDGPIDDVTVASYLGALDRLMIKDDLPAWNTHIRSAARLRKSPKRHFCDPSVACMALGLSADRLLADLEYMGLLFESAVIHDLRVYAGSLGAYLFHYRDSNGLEADAIIEMPDGSWAAVEVKLGFGASDEAAKSLLAVAETIDQSKMGPPRALIVITGSGFAHRRKDGVTVLPLGVLRD